MNRSLAPLPLILAVMSLAAASTLAADASGTVTRNGSPLQNAVIWVDVPNAAPVPPRKPFVLDQRNLTFIPKVLAIPVGSTVDFPNNDRVFHNVFSLRDGKKFDLGLYPVGAKKRVVFDHPGLCRIFCNIHPNMAAYIMVVNTPYYDVSDAKGRFSLSNIPTGSHTYHLWRPGGKTVTGKLDVQPGKPLEIRWP